MVNTAVENLPEVSGVEPLSAASRCGVQVGDRIAAVNGVVPRDILEWQRLVDNDTCELQIVRGRESLELEIVRTVGEPFGVSINSAVFDRIHTCDNHCEFCFIYQLPKGMRRSLYLKDDDYRLSFLFGNFTTLTRFTEADLERVVEERLSPLYVSVHATNPHARSEMLRNTRGGFSLRWMKVLLQNDINIRAQIVLCPGVNDGEVLNETLATLLEEYSGLESIAIVPLGLSRFNTESRMRVQTADEAVEVIRTVTLWQERFASVLKRQPIHLADEFYLVAGSQLPSASFYGEYPMLEDGVGLVRSFVDAFAGTGPDLSGRHDGFFSSVDVAATDYVRTVNPAAETSLRAAATPVSIRGVRHKAYESLGVVTGSYGAKFLRPLLDEHGYSNIQVVEVVNSHFGGNTAVAGLMTGGDIRATLAQYPADMRFLVPNVCLNNGMFLDGVSVEEVATEFNVEVIATSGAALRTRLDAEKERSAHV